MQVQMAEPTAISGLGERADQVHVPQLIGIALASACMGLGLVYALARPVHASQPTQTSMSTALDEPSIAEPDATPLKKPKAAANRSTAAVTSSHAGHAALPVSEHARARAAARAAATAHAVVIKRSSVPTNKRLADRRVQRGAINYVRCDGLERHRQGTPCPRDRALEAAVWSSLQALPQCRNADPGWGEAELRLTWRRGTAPQLDLKPSAGDRGTLNWRAVSKCAGPTLTKLRTHPKMQRSVVTFRFGLN
jgi:hypothetical protein